MWKLFVYFLFSGRFILFFWLNLFCEFVIFDGYLFLYFFILFIMNLLGIFIFFYDMFYFWFCWFCEGLFLILLLCCFLFVLFFEVFENVGFSIVIGNVLICWLFCFCVRKFVIFFLKLIF